MSIKDKERWERLAALGVKREMPTPEGEAKMSAVILQLAEPLMKQHGKTAERAEAILMLTIAGWNKSMFPPDKQPIIEKDLIDTFVPKDGSAEAVGVAVEVMDIVLEEYWLGDDDLEADTGGPLNIEQPTEITAKPLSPKDQDDRIRMVFGLSSNDPLPEVDDETLTAYRDYLAKNLTFPFQAEHGAEYGHPERVKVIGLGDPDEEPSRYRSFLFR